MSFHRIRPFVSHAVFHHTETSHSNHSAGDWSLLLAYRSAAIRTLMDGCGPTEDRACIFFGVQRFVSRADEIRPVQTDE